MPSKATLKVYRSYRQRKFREADGVIVIEGEKLVEEALASDRLRVHQVLLREDVAPRLADLLAHYPHETVGQKTLEQLTQFRSPPPVWMLADRPEVQRPAFTGLSLYLDGVQDPGNVGTIWRIADWFGVDSVFGSPDTADFWHPKTLQASMGAFLRVPAERLPFETLRPQLPPHFPLVGADMRGENPFKTRLPAPALLVVGSEGQGLTEELNAALTHRLSIPRAARGGAESLNAAVATGILVALWQNS